MKKANMTILASILVMALVAAGVSLGTGAWFSAGPVEAEPFEMNTATMTMSIVEAGPYTFDNLKPGDEFGPIIVKIQNTGTMDINSLAISWELNEGAELRPGYAGWMLADKIIVTGMREFIPGDGWLDDLGDPQYFQTLVEDNTEPFTLLELAQSYAIGRDEPHDSSGTGHDKLDQFGKYKKYASDGVTGSGYDATEGPAIIEGGTYWMELTFKFSEEAENNLQTRSVSLSITFFGMQDYTDQRP